MISIARYANTRRWCSRRCENSPDAGIAPSRPPTVKILSVIEAFCHGGAQTVLLDTLLSLPEHQHRVIHFSSANSIAAEPTFVEALRSAGIDCIDTHWDSLRDDEQRSDILDGFRPDVVMFHWWGSDPWLPWVNSPKPDRPAFVCVLHHEGIAAKAGYDRYVLVSRSQLPQVSQVPAERVVVIPNGIDLERFHFAGDERETPSTLSSGRSSLDD